MTLHDIPHGTPAGSGQNVPATGEQLARQQAIKQIERRRRFWIWAAMSTLLMVSCPSGEVDSSADRLTLIPTRMRTPEVLAI